MFGWILIVLGFFLVIHGLDRWSTSILLQYQKSIMFNETFRNKIVEYYNKNDVIQDEMNPIPRFFFKKFGIKKGLLVMDFVLFFPLMIYFLVLMVYNLLHPLILFTAIYFIAGMLFSQVLRAFVTKKRIKKLGLKLEVI